MDGERGVATGVKRLLCVAAGAGVLASSNDLRILSIGPAIELDLNRRPAQDRAQALRMGPAIPQHSNHLE